MANKNFGVNGLDVFGSGNPKIETAASELTISANSNVAISTDVTVTGDLKVTGLSTFSGNLIIGTASTGVVARTDGTLNVSGISTFSGGLDVTGHTETDTLNVSGVSTFSSNLDILGSGISKIETDSVLNINAPLVSISTSITVGGAVTASNFSGIGSDITDLDPSNISGKSFSVKDHSYVFSERNEIVWNQSVYTANVGYSTISTTNFYINAAWNDPDNPQNDASQEYNHINSYANTGDYDLDGDGIVSPDDIWEATNVVGYVNRVAGPFSYRTHVPANATRRTLSERKKFYTKKSKHWIELGDNSTIQAGSSVITNVNIYGDPNRDSHRMCELSPGVGIYTGVWITTSNTHYPFDPTALVPETSGAPASSFDKVFDDGTVIESIVMHEDGLTGDIYLNKPNISSYSIVSTGFGHIWVGFGTDGAYSIRGHKWTGPIHDLSNTLGWYELTNYFGEWKRQYPDGSINDGWMPSRTEILSGNYFTGISWEDPLNAGEYRNFVEPPSPIFSTNIGIGTDTFTNEGTLSHNVELSGTYLNGSSYGKIVSIGSSENLNQLSKLSLSNNWDITLGMSTFIPNPDPEYCFPGQSGFISVAQTAGGGKVLSWGDYWDFADGIAPVLSTNGNDVDIIGYYVRSNTSIIADVISDVG